MNKIIFLKPYFKKTLWANDNIKKMYHLQNNVGEAWLISTINKHESIVKGSEQKFSDFIKENPSFFNLTKERVQTFVYPNLTKFLDAKLPLSIQVHPDDEYAQKLGSLGKNECWYVLKNSQEPFILGTNTTDIRIIEQNINTKNIEQYLNKVPLQVNDFVSIESGLVHGIPADTLVFELQQSSDITYRLYDYERVDELGQKRQIHIKESLETIKLNLKPKVQKQLTNGFYQTKNFNLTKLELNNQELKVSTHLAKHCVEIVIYQGEGFINSIKIKAGDVLIVSKQALNFKLKGQIKLFLNYL
ncbi:MULTISPECIES: type I phosphomannose isomerase catalytic subunit [unclassified Mycoplasma]|uniref:type I phosphomannose isomerase catalytic subunit n=1 Tax=unclassified Mycoplasma TaxID=2683645 RepID=UPI00211C0327|nr:MULTISPECIES: type I phosphomannose isomerase catalytic subunit [unclassified Mycoplasma]UUM19898.1 class I mannose-6-phosphate isomerase [Mycoplasma sp. 1578d]UUM24878.1 class I mannose-6-phosphate isomerase [Mycoplasma sp. 3686d]